MADAPRRADGLYDGAALVQWWLTQQTDDAALLSGDPKDFWSAEFRKTRTQREQAALGRELGGLVPHAYLLDSMRRLGFWLGRMADRISRLGPTVNDEYQEAVRAVEAEIRAEILKAESFCKCELLFWAPEASEPLRVPLPRSYIEIPAPPSMFFLVFVLPDGTIDFWNWRPVSQVDSEAPEGVEGELLWQPSKS